ncbi:MAG: sugar kinase [Trueperaceae bacterium]
MKEDAEISRPTRFDVTSLGETMLRMSVPQGERLQQLSHLAVSPGGAESNVCAALAGLGRKCGWVSRLPNNPLGLSVLRALKGAGVDVSSVGLVADERMGSYYVEFASPPRATQVYYDRKGSAAAGMTADHVDWDYLLDTRVLHLTGITPALSDSCRALASEAVARARAARVPVSLDINYRIRLWSRDEASSCLLELARDVDILICGRADAARLFDLTGDVRQTIEALQELTRARSLVLTLAEEGAVALHDSQFLEQPSLGAEVVDKLGAGDAFAAGVLDGWLDGSLAQGLHRGAALAALALSQSGDMLVSNREELTAVMAAGPERIVR